MDCFLNNGSKIIQAILFSKIKKIFSTIKVTKPATGESCNDASLVVIIVNGREDVLKNVNNIRGEQMWKKPLPAALVQKAPSQLINLRKLLRKFCRFSKNPTSDLEHTSLSAVPSLTIWAKAATRSLKISPGANKESTRRFCCLNLSANHLQVRQYNDVLRPDLSSSL